MAPPFRIFAKLELKSPNVVKGVELEGLKVVGVASQLARDYASAGVDELMVQDVVANLYQRPSAFPLVQEIAHGVYLPLTVGGGICSVEDAIRLCHSGADRIAINTAAVKRPALLEEIATKLGSQAVVVIVEAKRNSRDVWEVMTEGGREKSGMDVAKWVSELEHYGVGEVLGMSIDSDGRATGPDLELAKILRQATQLPLIYQGGVRTQDDVKNLQQIGLQGVALASALHFGVLQVDELKKELMEAGISVRL